MGRVRFGVPVALVTWFRDRYGIDAAVETGAFRGASTVELARVLARVWSCEPEEQCLRMAARAVRAAGCADRVRLLQADSTECLPALLADIDEPVVFWLDAHWSPWMPVGPRLQCPVRHELDAIARWPHAGRSVIMVDDAGLYRDRPDDPRHRPAEWPDADELAARIAAVTGGPVREVDDVLVSGPGPGGTVP